MNEQSILLGLSGSEQSRNAAEVAWLMAKRLNAKVVCEHVIDKHGIWEMLRSDTPGFVGGGKYIEIFDSIIDSLEDLAKKLATEYDAAAKFAGVKSICETKLGNPIQVLVADAKKHDIVIVGHLPSFRRSQERPMGNYIRHSIAEGVAHESSVPVMIVQSEPVPWDGMTIVSEVDHINSNYIRSCLKLSRLLGLKPSIELWGTGLREEEPAELRDNLWQQIPETQNAEIEIEYFGGHAAVERKDLFHGDDVTQAALLPSETLFVLPTRGIGGERISVFGIEPEEFIRSLALPCLLLWPEDHRSFILDAEEKKKLATGMA